MDEFTQRQPRLAEIERFAEMIQYYSGRILDASKRIEAMPSYPTRAEDALEQALDKLTQALKVLYERVDRT